jgi:hypothetical protein
VHALQPLIGQLIFAIQPSKLENNGAAQSINCYVDKCYTVAARYYKLVVIHISSISSIVPVVVMATTLAKAQMPESILDATQACLRSFNECLTVPVLGHREWVENRLADFNLWAAGVGASAKESLSLDSRLVCEPGMRTVVIDLLKTLMVYVHQCKNIGRFNVTYHFAGLTVFQGSKSKANVENLMPPHQVRL